MKISKISLGFVALLFAASAHADLLIEPYIGYSTGHWTQGNTTQSQSGVDYGARLGYQSLGFMVGLDYMTGNQTDNSTNAYTITPNDLGVFVGYKFPVLLRVYGVYNFMSDPKYVNGSSSVKPDGSSYKLGLRFTGLPFVVSGLEYYGGTYTKDKVSNTSLNPNLTTSMFG